MANSYLGSRPTPPELQQPTPVAPTPSGVPGASGSLYGALQSQPVGPSVVGVDNNTQDTTGNSQMNHEPMPSMAMHKSMQAPPEASDQAPGSMHGALNLQGLDPATQKALIDLANEQVVPNRHDYSIPNSASPSPTPKDINPELAQSIKQGFGGK